MTLAADGGGGGTILIDPDSLRTAAGRLKGIAGDLQMIESVLSDVGYPNMPPGTYAVVQPAVASSVYSISSEIGPLSDTPTELTRRAFWAEYADRMMSGYVLTGTAKKEFEQWLADGTLLKYASPDEARSAGVELAKVSGDFKNDPVLLINLAADLKGGEQATDAAVRNAFSAGFVNEFGAKNMELVPRVIQAMESPNGLTAIAGGVDPRSLQYTARMWQQEGLTLSDLKVDPVKDLLAPFSIALANATYSGQITRTVEDDIANDDDTWATAALLSQGGKFGTQFLLDCFKSGVVDKIAHDSPYNVRGSLEQPPGAEPYDLGWSTGHALPGDTKQIVMEALARNPEAASQALTMPLCDVRAANDYGQWSTVQDPMTLLYQYGHFDDDGQSFGNAYLQATKYLNGDYGTHGALPYPHSNYDAAKLTENGLVQMLGDDHDGMSNFKNGLASDLVQHHVGDLYDSALRNLSNDAPEGVKLQGLEPVANAQVPAGQLQLSRDALIHTIDHLSQNDTAFSTFVHGSAAYQAAVIDANTTTVPTPGQTPEWATRVGSFDAALMNGTDINRIEDFDASSARHELVASFFKEAANGVVTIEDPIAEAAAHTGIGAAIDSIFPAPDPHSIDWKNFDVHQTMQNSLQASITAGYYKHGLISYAPPGDVVNGSSLVAYDQLPSGSDAQTNYAAWMNRDQVTNVTGAAVTTAQNTISAHVAHFSP